MVVSILQILHSLECGGAERLAVRLAQGLAPDYRTHFVCLDVKGPLADEAQAQGFPIHVLHRQPGIDWACAKGLQKLVREMQPAVILAHQYTPFFYAGLARGLSRRPPIIFIEHGRHYPDRRKPRRILANRLLLRRHDGVIAVAASVKKALVGNEGIPAARIRVIYNGIDPAPFVAACEDSELRQRVRQELGLIDQIAIIQVARLDPLKDHATAIAAVERLEQHNVRLLIVGDGPEKERIRRRIEESPVPERFQLVGYRQDIPALLAAADIFLLSSVSEGLPVTVLEAMAAGLPVVATTVGDLPEVIHPGDTGCLVSPGQVAPMQEVLSLLCRSASERSKLGRAGRALVLTKFTEAKMHAAYRAVIQETLRKAGRL